MQCCEISHGLLKKLLEKWTPVTENLVALGLCNNDLYYLLKDKMTRETVLPLPQLILTMAISWPIAAG